MSETEKAPALTGEVPRLPGTVWPREGEAWPTGYDGDPICVTEDGRAGGEP